MASTDSYGQGVSIAALTDAPNAATLAFNIVDAVTQRTVNRFASASARAATLTSPNEGMVTWLQDANSIEVYQGSAWKGLFYGDTSPQSYAVEWRATTTNPALGNGKLAGSYMKIGGLCYVSITLTIGSTTNKGTGTYKFTLPFTAATITDGSPGVLSATFSRTSTPNHGGGDSPIPNAATTTDFIWFPNPSIVGDANVWTHAQPWVPATGDVFRVYGTYQTAT